MTLVVEGSAGLGKTTVWSAALAALRDQAGQVLVSTPTEAESRLSYSGLADLLASVFPTIRAAIPAPQARSLAIAMRLEDPGDAAPDETAVARGALEALRALGRAEGPVLVAIDDLRWLDGPSLTAITYAARRLLPDDHVKLLTTHRTGAALPPGLDMDRVERLALEPMTVGGIHRIVRLLTGVSLSRPRLLEIHAASAGNPLHAVELARAVDGSAPAAAAGSLAALFEARVAALPKPTQDALVLLAASSDRSPARLDSSSDGTFGDDIVAAVDADLVSHTGGDVRFVHPLVGHAAYQRASAATRREAHRALAVTSSTDEERALHLGRAADGPDAAAADAIDAAGREARNRGVRALSAALYESAARITPPEDVAVRARRLLAAATGWFDAGDTDRVEAILAPLVGQLDPGDLRAEARWRLGIALDEAGRWQEATGLWRAALEESSAPGLRSQVECSLAITGMYTESMQVAETWSAAAVREADGRADSRSLARSLAVRAFIVSMRGIDDPEPVMARALALEAGMEEPLGDWSPSALAAECARHLGDVDGALRHYATVLARAAGAGDANHEQWAAFGLAQTELLAGGYERASELADVVLDIADQTRVMRIPARSLRAHADAYLGDFGAARRGIAESMAMAAAADEATHLFGAWIVMATIEMCSGDAIAATRAYAEARRLGTELGLAHATMRRACLQEAEVAASVGELDQAVAALAAFDGIVGANPPAWTRPLRHRADAAVRAARGDVAGAVTELEAALALPGGLAPDRGRALLALGAALRRLREYRRAREVLEAAVAVFGELGSGPWLEAARRELDRVPGRRSGPERELTSAETRIADLVAAGRTNREVAEELVLTVKTIEVTLTRVYQKLGVRSRAELAAQFRDRPSA